ncbi:MAG: tetratricopeptide repeat protein [Bacteroidota bacterium]|nr:tetratricopeptide repeat protein [Bacteroidota bacterium]
MKPIKAILLFCTLLIVTGTSLHAQPAIIDNTTQKIPLSYASISHINRLNQLCLKYIALRKPDIAVKYANSALILALQHHDPRGEALALLNLGDAYMTRGSYHRALSHLVRSLKLKDTIQDNRFTSKIYHDLATVFVRMKQYPLALKYFYRTTPQYDEPVFIHRKHHRVSRAIKDSTLQIIPLQLTRTLTTNPTFVSSPDSIKLLSAIFNDDTILKNDSTIDYSKIDDISQPIRDSDITEPFNDGKSAVAYGLIVHVKQPIAGKRNPFTRIVKVGHVFITMIKFNADSSSVSRTFGFYPNKDNLLSATPLHPGSSSFFKNDELHDWDEIVGKFITRRRFEKIMQIVKKYDKRRYHLNKNNCTDFGLEVANESGIKILNTKSKWPLGGGNNPANTGQSILEYKVKNMDTESLMGLFIRSNLSHRHNIEE